MYSLRARRLRPTRERSERAKPAADTPGLHDQQHIIRRLRRDPSDVKYPRPVTQAEAVPRSAVARPFPVRGLLYRTACLNRAGIANFRFHDVRHTCASYLAQDNANQTTIMHALGHKTLAAAARYMHLSVEHVAAATAKAMAGKLTP